jgi:outer membrane protein OmpA-like peptidoglycan-associated protein
MQWGYSGGGCSLGGCSCRGTGFGDTPADKDERLKELAKRGAPRANLEEGEDMYVRTNDGQVGAYGLAPAAAAELGLAIFSATQGITTGGDLVVTSNVGNYIRPTRPAGSRFVKCTRPFRISTYMLMPPVGRVFVPDNDFWFELEFEYNGTDIRGATIRPLRDKSSTLYKSKFVINFDAQAKSLPEDPVAEITFKINGSWMKWDPLPFANETFTLWGDLDVRADGTVRLQIDSEKKRVRPRDLPASCEIVRPRVEVPKVPVPVIHSMNVLFAPPGSTRIRGGDEEKIIRWYLAIPGTMKGKIESGALPIIVRGYASTTQGGPANLRLSMARAERVKAILQRFAGSAARIQTQGRGEYEAGTKDEIEDLKERRVNIFVQDIEMR